MARALVKLAIKTVYAAERINYKLDKRLFVEINERV